MKHDEEADEAKISKKDLWKYAMPALVGLLLIVSVVQAFQIAAIGKAENTASATGVLDTAGWTADEKMNYEMHGIIPARFKGSTSSPAGAGMVGGC